MRRSFRRRSGVAAPWTALLIPLLLLGLTLGACQREEATTEEATTEEVPAATTAEPEPTGTDLTTGEPVVAAEEKVIAALAGPLRWDPQNTKVGVGDTITWKIGPTRNIEHGLRFPDATVCATAQDVMTFTPPLTDCQSKTSKNANDILVKAVVNKPLPNDLPFDCVVHGTAMKGSLQPK